ncbi:CPBP family intramembrane glutamic endopeptidase [Enterococcus rivorum]|uniref:CAAX prenyl protease 2/Lysostaphin resistance protein A-like domain-containing protein n=1 Tax=Enterococcus rivorum TaxID=762845 RepID=A0A1E5KWW1_9ENTE|nr:type II CAAX endopeptidase family protein [Enterococcus rivorum]MBP2097297.1 membrane protease YdiL (CAAX protease family) [Enterococcus rivorum]OEH82351.1 hypothetical protein BCR26_02665 [Enterococcus rivorum]
MEQVKRAAKGTLMAIGLFVLAQVPQIFLLMMKKSLVSDIVTALIFIVVTGLFIFIAKKRGYFSKNEERFSGRNIGIVFAGFILMRILAVVFTLIMQETTKNDQVIQEFTANISTINLFLLLCVGAPVMEEIIFRGVIINELFRRKDNQPISLKMEIIGLVVSSIAFGSIHLSSDIISFLLYVTLGATMGTVYLLTKSLECSIAVHFLNNFLPFLVLAFTK